MCNQVVELKAEKAEQGVCLSLNESLPNIKHAQALKKIIGRLDNRVLADRFGA